MLYYLLSNTRHTNPIAFLPLFLLLFLFTTLPPQISAHNYQRDADSIENLLKKAKGEEKAVQLGHLVGIYAILDTAQSFEWFKKMIVFTETFHYDFQEHNTFNYLTGQYHAHAKYGAAIKILQKALNFVKRNRLPKAIGFAYSTIGLYYLRMNNYTLAKQYQFKALHQFKNIDYPYGISTVYLELGHYYYMTSKYLTALKYFYQALHINQRLKLQHETAAVLYHIGITKYFLGDYPESIEYILKSLHYWEKLHETANIWNSYEILGNIYIKTGNYKEALKNHKKALAIREKSILSGLKQGYDHMSPDNELNIAYSYNNIA